MPTCATMTKVAGRCGDIATDVGSAIEARTRAHDPVSPSAAVDVVLAPPRHRSSMITRPSCGS